MSQHILTTCLTVLALSLSSCSGDGDSENGGQWRFEWKLCGRLGGRCE